MYQQEGGVFLFCPSSDSYKSGGRKNLFQGFSHVFSVGVSNPVDYAVFGSDNEHYEAMSASSLLPAWLKIVPRGTERFCPGRKSATGTTSVNLGHCRVCYGDETYR